MQVLPQSSSVSAAASRADSRSLAATQVGAPLRPVTVRDAIADLPAIQNGHMVEEMEYVSGPVSSRARYRACLLGGKGLAGGQTVLAGATGHACGPDTACLLRPSHPPDPLLLAPVPAPPVCRRCLPSSSTCAATAPT